jgi:soluble lytic murein transglycosylase-like protein
LPDLGPVEFFARVIWQESRFNASAVSPKGAEGIAQFMPRTADWHGLGNPFDPIEALRHAASYLRELRSDSPRQPTMRAQAE